MNSQGDGTEIRQPGARGPDRPPPAAPFLAGAWPLAVLLLLATLPYVGILRNDFAYAYDDKAQILDNPYVHSFGHLREVLTTSVWSFKPGHGVSNYYRPVMTIGFLLCYQLFGPVAYGYHLTSLLLHAAVVTMLFLFAERLFCDRGAAFGAAVAVRAPSDSRRACGVDFRRERPGGDLLLCAHFLVFLAGGGAARRTAARDASRHDGKFLLALFSKEPALTLPLLAAIYEHFYRADRARDYAGREIPPAGAALARFPGLLADAGPTPGSRCAQPRACTRSPRSKLCFLPWLCWANTSQNFFGRRTFRRFMFSMRAPGFSRRAYWQALARSPFVRVVFVVLWKRARPASFGILWLLGYARARC